jgi:hypothetical protein
MTAVCMRSRATAQVKSFHRIYTLGLTWRLVRCLTLQQHQSQAKKKMFTATLGAINKRGFYLTHAGAKEADGLLEGIELGG